MWALEPDDPRAVGGYPLLARIATGGMAVIYLGRSTGGRTVAVKRMHAELAADSGLRRRFAREVEIGRTVGGRYSPAVLDADPDDTVPWLAAEFLPSVSLRDAVRVAGPLSVSAVWSVAGGLAEALTFLHAAGVAHLDVTARNVLLSHDGVRLVDFGLARRSVGPGSESVPVAGSPGFLAPERLRGVAGPPSDVYAMGATLTYACLGSVVGGTAPAVAVRDPVLRALIERCMRARPEDRPTASAVLEAAAAASGAGSGTRLPAAVVAAIDRSAAEAANPPVPYPVRPLVPRPASRTASRLDRRSVLRLAVGGGATATVAAVVAAVSGWFDRTVDEPGPGREAGASTPSTPSMPSTPDVTGSSQTRTLEFRCEGELTLIALTYTVDGVTVSLSDVPLPWRQTVAVPPPPRRTTWRLTYRQPPGQVSYRVSVDGLTVQTGGSSSASQPHDGDADGEV